MSHLLAISVGPVQEFITAARRTRDLWFGSYLLSEISKAVARAVEDQGGWLIFPASSAEDNIANKILAEVNDPKAVADHAKREARKCWEGYAIQARGKLDEYPIKVIVPGVWDEQLPDVIDFFAAWVPRTPDYQADRARIERLLAGRKNCRDFLPAKGRVRVPKSSLDGQRESVLLQPPPGVDRKTFRDNWPTILRLSSGEELDVVGVTKRLGKKKGDSDPPYPSVARVAAETWLQGVQSRDKLQPLKDACQKLVAKRLHCVREEKYQYFPYEGTVIYKDRHTDLRNELGLGDNDLNEVAAALKDIGGEPNPYLAVLVADGDSMGAALWNLSSVQEHQAFSQKLAAFAVAARTIVADHYGVLVYAGGDDVLAFVPVHTCLRCARSLRDKFHQETSKTLSVGVAIGHFMENLEELLEYGRAAEKHAKQPDRDGLAVHLHKRGGSPIRVRAKWTDHPNERLTDYARLILEEAIPSKLPYDLRKLAEFYTGWRADTEEKKRTAAEAMKQDVLRVIRDKQPRSGRKHMPEVEKILKTVNDVPSLHSFAEELLVARQIATALRQAEEHPVPVTETAS